MAEKLWHLKRCDLFERLSHAELERLESRSLVRRFPRKSLIYMPSDQADGVLLLTTGRVRIGTVTDEGKQAILAFVEPGELFGELAVFDDGDREDYAEATEDSTLLFLPAEEIRSLAENHAGVAFGVTKLIGLRRRRIERRLKSLLFRSNRERLIHLLLELAEQYGKPADGGIDLGIKLSHQDLAAVIGSTRETVTIVLGELQAEGAIRLGRRKVLLLEAARLADDIGLESAVAIPSG
jgi:CRP/FNR family transcriptional regulator, cyclic AMP receptor protein